MTNIPYISLNTNDSNVNLVSAQQNSTQKNYHPITRFSNTQNLAEQAYSPGIRAFLGFQDEDNPIPEDVELEELALNVHQSFPQIYPRWKQKLAKLEQRIHSRHGHSIDNAISKYDHHNSFALPIDEESETNDPPDITSTFLTTTEYLVNKDVELAEVTFKAWIFFRETLYHLFGHLILPIMLLIDGKTFAENHYFLPRLHHGKRIFFMQLFVYSSIYFINLSILFQWTDFFQIFELGVLDMLFFLRSITIASKFAYLPDVELYSIAHYRDPKARSISRQLIAGWYQPSDASLLRELLLAATRLDIDICFTFLRWQGSPQKTFRTIQASINCLRRFIGLPSSDEYPKPGDRHSETDQSLSFIASHYAADCPNKKVEEYVPGGFISILTLAYQLLLDSSANVRMIPYAKYSMIFSTFYAAIPFIYKLFTPLGHFSYLDVFISICYIFSNIFLVQICLLYLITGLVDVKRREICGQLLAAVLTESGYVPSVCIQDSKCLGFSCGVDSVSKFVKSTMYTTDSSMGFILDFTCPQNVSGFLTLKRVLDETGKLFTKRIALYTTAFVVFDILLVVYLLIQTLSGIPLQPLAIIIVLTWVIVSLCIFIGIILPGSRANNMVRLHSSLIVSWQLSVRSLMTAALKSLTWAPSSFLLQNINESKRFFDTHHFGYYRKLLHKSCVQNLMQRLNHTDSLLTSAEKQIIVNGSLDPLKVAGIPIETSMIHSIIVVLASGLFAAFRRYILEAGEIQISN